MRSVFRLAGRRPELLGLLREVSRLGPPPATRFREMLGPFIERATSFLEEGMAAGEFRRQDARLLLLATYSTVIGVATEVEVLRALGVEPTARSLVRRRAELLAFLRSALLPRVPALADVRFPTDARCASARSAVRGRRQLSEGDVRCPRPAPTTCGPGRPARWRGAGWTLGLGRGVAPAGGGSGLVGA